MFQKLAGFIDRNHQPFCFGVLVACCLFLAVLQQEGNRKPYCPHRVSGPCEHCSPDSPGPGGPPIILPGGESPPEENTAGAPQGKEPPPPAPPRDPRSPRIKTTVSPVTQ